MLRITLVRSSLLILRYVILGFLCIIVISPVMTAFLGSVRTTNEFLSRPFGFPEGAWNFEFYLGGAIRFGALWATASSSPASRWC